MSALKDTREERFSRFVAAGIPRYRAYPLAGYRPNNGQPYRLAERCRVKNRIKELIEEGFRVAQLTPAMVIEGLANEAANAKEGATRVRAYELLGKWFGIWHGEKPPAEMTEAELIKALQKAIETQPDVRAAALQALGGTLPPELADIEAQGTA